MGSACTACTIFDDPDVRDRERRIPNTEHQPLINYPDPTRDSNGSSASISSQSRTQPKSSIADRMSMFEQNDKRSGKKSYKKSKPKTSTNTNKPRKKWAVKGIDDKSSSKNNKKPVNATSIQSNITIDDDPEPSISMSHKDRMKLYEQDLQNVQEKEKQRIAQHKESRGGYSGVKVCDLYPILSII